MGFFDSDSQTDIKNETNNQSSGAQDKATSISSGGDVTVTDGDAIQSMFEVTMAAMNGQQQAAENALGLNQKSLDFAESVKNPLGDNVKKLGLYFAVGTVLIFVVATVMPKFKG